MNNTHVIFCALLSTVASGCATTLAHGAEPAPKGGVEVTMGANTSIVSDGVTNPDVC